jgi:hypothetical protein
MVNKAEVTDPFRENCIQLVEKISVSSPEFAKLFLCNLGTDPFGKIDHFISIKQKITVIRRKAGTVSEALPPPKIPFKLTSIHLRILRNVGEEGNGDRFSSLYGI